MRLNRRTFLSSLAWGAASCAAAFLLGEIGYRGFLRTRSYQTGNFELYAIGESSTYGEPYGPQAAFPELVKLMFDGRIGGRPIVVHNLGRPGDTLYPQSIALLRMLKFRNKEMPAAVLIYSGHNEPFEGAGQRSRLAGYYSALKRAVLYHSMLATDLLITFERTFQVQGLRDSVDYDFHLRRAITESRQVGALPVLSTVIANVGDIEPNAHCSADGPSNASSLSCTDAVATLKPGIDLERAGRPAEAMKRYEDILRRDPPFLKALLQFKIGKCLETLGRYEEADRHFWLAIDSDQGERFGRAKTSFNDNLRRVAAADAIPLVDVVRLFEAHSPHGIVGDELMSDGHHPNLNGYILLAEGFANELSVEFHEPIRRRLDVTSTMAEAGLVASQQATALTHSGLWLLSVSFNHPEAEGRFALALHSFKSAVALDPDSYEAWAGLGLTQAARHQGMLRDPAFVAAVKGMTFQRRPSHEEVLALVRQLRQAGTEESVLNEMLRVGLRPGGMSAN